MGSYEHLSFELIDRFDIYNVSDRAIATISIHATLVLNDVCSLPVEEKIDFLNFIYSLKPWASKKEEKIIKSLCQQLYINNGLLMKESVILPTDQIFKNHLDQYLIDKYGLSIFQTTNRLSASQ